MRYFIAYVIKGEAGEYHKKLSDTIAQQFNYKPLSKKVPPHLTLKAPFEADTNIKEIENLISNFIAHKHAHELLLEGFGSFRGEVIFMDVKPSQEATILINNLTNELKKITWLPFERFETQEGVAHLHATLAYADIKENFNKIKNRTSSHFYF